MTANVLVGNAVHNLCDQEIVRLQKSRIDFHLYGKSDNCRLQRCSKCKLKRHCTCMCHARYFKPK